MATLPSSLKQHRVHSSSPRSVVDGIIRYAPVKSIWFIVMAGGALIGGVATFSWMAFSVFVVMTAWVLLFGHSLGSHRKLIHNSFECPKWLEYCLVYCGVQVGLAGPLGLLRQHELRDYAQRLPDCHDYLRHGSGFWRDGWLQIHCELVLDAPPTVTLEPRIGNDRFYRFIERTWMLQQLPPALLLFAIGGWGFVFWGVCARITAGVFGHWLIGYFAHNRGPMHVEVNGAAVQGHNIRFTSLLTMGECWHNNHHAYPGSARLGLHAGEWDPGWWVLSLLHRLGMVWNLRLPHDLPMRVELKQVDSLVWVARPAPTAAMGVGALLRESIRPSKFDGVPWQLKGPAVSLPASFFAWEAGPRTVFIRDTSANRLTLQRGSQYVQGLPALLLAARLRSGGFAALIACVMPFAIMVEAGRTLIEVGD